jgi:hypothetical protein
VKASFTAAIVVRSLLAAERSCCVTGCWVSRWRLWLGVCWPVSLDVDVVVAVDIKSGVSMKVDCGTGRQAGT